MYNILSKMLEQAKRNEATTMGDVAFLPTQVGTVRAAVKNLKRKKGKWNLEILEDKDGYTVYFENQLKIDVPRQHWDSFQGMFNEKIEDRFCLDLDTQLMEKIVISKKKLLESRKAELRKRIEEELNCPQLKSAEKVIQKYLDFFPLEQNLFENSTALIHLFPTCLADYTNQILKECGNDLGSIDLAMESFFQGFSDTDPLAGSRYKSSYRKMNLILEAKVNFAKDAIYSIRIEDGEIADRLEESMTNLTRIGNVFYPRLGQILSENGILENIKEVIEDSEN